MRVERVSWSEDIEAALRANASETGAAHSPVSQANDYEAMRVARGWPTPMHMHRMADALDIITPARYGDILRWFGDLCDGIEQPDPPAALSPTHKYFFTPADIYQAVDGHDPDAVSAVRFCCEHETDWMSPHCWACDKRMQRA